MLKLVHFLSAGRPRSADQVAPEVRKMGAAEFVSGLGSTAAMLALYFVAFSSAGSAADAAYVSAAYTVGVMASSFAAPAVSARFDHRHVVVMQVVLKAAIFIVPWVLSLRGNLTVVSIIVVMGLTGLATGATQPAYYEVLQDLSAGYKVSAANAYIGARYSAAAVIGALVGGGVLAAVGPTWLLFANVLSYLPLLWVLLRLPESASGVATRVPRSPILVALAGIVRTPVLRYGILLDLVVVALSIPTALLTKLSSGVGSSAAYYGIVSAASGLGMVLAMPVLARLNTRRERPGVVIGAIVVLAVGLLCTGLVGATDRQGTAGVIWLSLAVCLAFLGSYAVGYKLLAVVQVSAAPKDRTVVIAAISFAVMGAATVTSLVEGALADVIPVWWIQFVAGGFAVMLAVFGVVAARRGWLPVWRPSTS